MIAYLGQESDEHLELDRSEFDYRRVFVSNAKVAGHRLSDINLPQQFGAIATRVRRGDVEMLAHDNTVLELGDRVRIVARREDMDTISRFFGDSYRALSEIDILTFSLGIALGLLVGLIPIPLPGGLVFTLGFAGGPLLVALILGAIGRTGPLIWSIPYSANLTLRQIGLVMFLAGVGTKAGYAFVSTFTQGDGLYLFIAGAIITTLTALATLWIGYRLLKIPISLLIGLLAGLADPAGRAGIRARTDRERPAESRLCQYVRTGSHRQDHPGTVAGRFSALRRSTHESAPLAGKPAPHEVLINVPRLISADCSTAHMEAAW